MSKNPRSPLLRYGAAIASVVLAAGLRLLIDPVLGNHLPFVTFFLAVLFTAWFGGVGPSLVALPLSAVAATYFFISPRGFQGLPQIHDMVGLGVFLSVGAVCALFAEAMQAARRRAEASEARYRQIVETAHEGVWVIDAEQRTTFANQRMAEILGCTADELAGRSAFDFVFPEDRAEGERLVQQRRQGVRAELDLRYRRRDGSEVWLHVNASPLFDAGRYAGSLGLFTDITARRRAEEELRQSEQELADFFDNATVGLHWVGPDGTILRVNQAELDVLGYDREEYVGRLIAAFHADQDVIADILTRLQRGERLNDYPARMRCKDGSIKDVLIDSSVLWRDGKFVHTRCFTRDVTTQRRAEEEARGRERQLELVTDNAPVFIAHCDAARRFKFVNKPYAARFGLLPSDVLGKTFADVLGPEAAATIEPYVAAVLAGRRVEFEVEVPYRVLGRLQMQGVYQPEFDAAGQVVGFVSVILNVTERKRAAVALQASEERFRLLTDALPVLISYVDADQRYRVVNAQYEAWFGRPRHEIQGRTLREVIGEAGYASLRGHVQEALAGQEVTYERLIPYRHAGTRFIRANYIPYREGGQVQGFFSLVSDVTQSKRAEQNAQFLADASATLANLVDDESTLQKVARLAVPHFADWCAVDMLDEGGDLRRVAVAHVDPSKVELARDLHSRFPPDPKAAHGVWHILRTGRAEIVSEIDDKLLVATVEDAELLRTLLELGLRSYMGVPLTVRGKVLGVVTFIAAESGRRYDPSDLAVAEDLARRAAVAVENARLYQEVREADRKKDEFLAILGHELRNPLAPISNAIQLLKLPGANGQMIAEAREMMERQVQHMVRLVDDLLDVSKIVRGKVELRREPVELAAVIARAVETSQPLIESEGHTLRVTLPPEPLQVRGDLMRLSQVVANLLNNAARYTERGGRISVEGTREGEAAVLRVRDTGIGIAADSLPRIWDMFVQADRRTKVSQGGMGIGLALVKGLVELHGGTVEARSEGAGQGSEFRVYLPLLTAKESDDEQPQREEPHARPAARRVLVVDDNVDAAESLAMILRLLGHETRVAHDGPSALTSAQAAAPEVAFFDLGMPGMDGYELARRFRNHPSLKEIILVALTGWGQDEDRRRTKEAGFDAHEVKPIGIETLGKLLSLRR